MGELETIGNGAVVSARKKAAATSKPFLPTSCPSCPGKSYSEACPEGWTEGADGMCAAPGAYEGICATAQSFIAGTDVEKAEVEFICQVCWPCSTALVEDSATNIVKQIL